MSFKDFYLLTEMPHLELWPGKFVDLKKEDGSKWIWKIAEIFKTYHDESLTIIPNLLANQFFVSMFIQDFKKLNPSEKKKMVDIIPPEFFRQIGIKIKEIDQEGIFDGEHNEFLGLNT